MNIINDLHHVVISHIASEFRSALVIGVILYIVLRVYLWKLSHNN